MFARLLTAKMVLDTKHDAGFYDVLPTKWSKDQIGYMREKGIVKGYLDGSFKPNQPVTKAEFAAMASRFDNLSDGGNMKFSDVDSNYWAAKYIYSAAKKGWVKGYEDGTFRPDRFRGKADGCSDFTGMMKSASDIFSRVKTLATNHMALYFTSGTTGEPKGVIHDHDRK